LDELAGKGLLFTNLHATGTRTDRGLEAIDLSVPPTPGRSIVKRIANEDIFSWGFIMKEHGYDNKFLYGGYGYFDNMNYFFGHNGFETIDKRFFSKDEVSFENAWGVCDEDLFTKSIREFDKSYEKGRPFMGIIMTTSNHRPFSYPEGRIDIPSGTGRNGAVKYADYAIGKFIRDAGGRPWAKDTLFIIVADHCAGSAGQTAIPVKHYEIPLIIYSPGHIIPQKIDKLTSQIDIAPTVLGLLNFSYKSKFFGEDILKMMPDQERAFIGTYQKLGYIKGNRLVVLDVKKSVSQYRFTRTSNETEAIQRDDELINEAIAYYQCEDYLYENLLDKTKEREVN
jgi:phosphoglycerol transferase MdoB-like AlkP superfamily enzyme